MGRKKKSLRTIDDFIHVVESQLEAQSRQDPLEIANFVEDFQEELKSDTTEQVETDNKPYMTNSPSMDDDFLGGVSSSTPILESESYSSHEPPSEDCLTKENNNLNLESLFFPLRQEKLPNKMVI